MLLEEMLKEEREFGRTEGKIEGKAGAIFVILSRLGEVSEELHEKILNEKRPDVLDSYIEKAVSANTIEEFQKFIEQ